MHWLIPKKQVVFQTLVDIGLFHLGIITFGFILIHSNSLLSAEIFLFFFYLSGRNFQNSQKI